VFDDVKDFVLTRGLFTALASFQRGFCLLPHALFPVSKADDLSADIYNVSLDTLHETLARFKVPCCGLCASFLLCGGPLASAAAAAT
jgi:hypothetical protein